MSRVVVVGAGIAGLACARQLAAAGITVNVRERARRLGGRMASPRIDGRPVDIGASYFTARDSSFVEQVEDWCRRGLARRWTDRFPVLSGDGLSEPDIGPWRYAAPGGLDSLIADLAGATPITVNTASPVSVVGAGPAVDSEPVDAVALAMPDPQAQRLLDPRLTQVRDQVASRRWEAVLALSARYPQRSWPELDGAFISGDDTLSWMADDGRRRGDGAPVLVAHSTTSFPSAAGAPAAEAGTAMVSALDRLLGCGTPLATRVRRWPFARPAQARDEPYFFGPDRIGLAGDGWGAPRVETAWLSGRALGRRIARELLD